MNEQTKKDLCLLMDALIDLSAGVMLSCGEDTASKVIDACEKIKEQLEKEMHHSLL